jgi:hypothetical protein
MEWRLMVSKTASFQKAPSATPFGCAIVAKSQHDHRALMADDNSPALSRFELAARELRALGRCINQADCSLIGISKSSVLETDALAGVTVLSGVGFRSPHNGCQG